MLLQPLEAFLRWLKDLPIRHRRNLIAMLINFMPNCEIELNECSLDEFENWLRRQSSKPAKELGAALAIKSIVDFTVMQHITDSQQWIEQAKNIDILIKQWITDGGQDFKTVCLQDHRRSLEFYAAQSAWVKSTWTELCQKHFTNEALKESLLPPGHS